MAQRLAILAAIFLCGCPSDDGPQIADLTAPGPVDMSVVQSKCPSEVPESCPDTVPSYANQVAAIFSQHCFPCHTTGGTEASVPLDTYDNVFAERGTILTQINECLMPSDGGAPFPDSAKLTLLTWLVCHAPNN